MTILTWDKVGERTYETGVDRGVLYKNGVGQYDKASAWNGLTTVTETPSGADAKPQYADNIKYLNLIAAEEFGCKIEAFTMPDAFAECDGTVEAAPGVIAAQQTRKPFGLSYRTRKGNDLAGSDFGYKLHLVYGAIAAPSEKAYATINDSPEAITFSWDVTTTPVAVTGLKPTALLTIDSTKVDAGALTALENLLYGTAGADARLPLPDEVIALFAAGAPTSATPTKPTWTAASHTVTIPTVTGIKYTNDATGATLAAGPVVLTVGQTLIVKAVALAGYAIPANTDVDWQFNYADA